VFFEYQVCFGSVLFGGVLPGVSVFFYQRPRLTPTTSANIIPSRHFPVSAFPVHRPTMIPYCVRSPPSPSGFQVLFVFSPIWWRGPVGVAASWSYRFLRSPFRSFQPQHAMGTRSPLFFILIFPTALGELMLTPLPPIQVHLSNTQLRSFDISWRILPFVREVFCGQDYAPFSCAPPVSSSFQRIGQLLPTPVFLVSPSVPFCRGFLRRPVRCDVSSTAVP